MGVGAMKGTTLIVTDKKYDKKNLVTKDFIEGNGYLIYKCFNNKFSQEKIFNEDEEFIVAIDGVIINNHELQSRYGVYDNFSLIKEMYKSHGNKLVNELRGSFYGIIYDKLKNKWEVFTNHLGQKPVYFYESKKENTFIASSDLFDLVKVLKAININFSLDEVGAYLMLSFGYMLMDTTLIKEIKKIDPGTILSYEGENLSKTEYFFLDNENYISDSEDKVIDNMHELLCNAVNSGFKKDEENGYKHISYLSGGLDSRMIAAIAHDLKYKDLTTLTFAENYSQDEKIARSIAADYKFENVFTSLNNGNFLLNIEDAVEANFGQILYSGSVHSRTVTKRINLEPYGFLHNGNLADVAQGDYISGLSHEKPILKEWSYSTRLLGRVDFMEKDLQDKYGNVERSAIYNRGINAILNGSISMMDSAETFEPYLHQDVVAYCSRMEPKYKYKEYAFLKMIQKYYPKAAQYKWQKWNMKPTDFNQRFMASFPGKVYRVLDGKVQKYLNHQSYDMNPFNKWDNTNEDLKNFVIEYFKENMELLSPYNDLKKDCEYIYKNGTLVEKTQVMTLLQFIKRIREI